MKLIRYEHPELSLADSFEGWFRNMFRDFGSFGSALDLSPNSHRNAADVGLRADLYESEGAFEAAFALPGLSKGDVKLGLVNSVLTVSGEFKDKHGESERSVAFSRSLAVPDGVDAEGIAAKMENGMLYVTLPKTEEKRPITIDIE